MTNLYMVTPRFHRTGSTLGVHPQSPHLSLKRMGTLSTSHSPRTAPRPIKEARHLWQTNIPSGLGRTRLRLPVVNPENAINNCAGKNQGGHPPIPLRSR